MPVILEKPQSSLIMSYRTKHGSMFCGNAEDFLDSRIGKKYQGQVQLIFTSPPFPLNRKKKYGNLNGEEYIEWLAGFAPLFRQMLTDDGSIVIELGNAWEPGAPVMSTLAMRALLSFLDAGHFKLCQQFICHNPARLPSPAQWVTIDRVRVKDAYTYVWWMSPASNPKADNRQVLKEYSPSMVKLLKRQSYNAGKRPSEHRIGERSFLKNNSGAIPSNVLTISNTNSSDEYQQYCREHGLQTHPARMQMELPEFFIKFTTEPGDLVLDPFAGSNTTGAVAERWQRRWLSVEPCTDYIEGSKGRFASIRRTI